VRTQYIKAGVQIATFAALVALPLAMLGEHIKTNINAIQTLVLVLFFVDAAATTARRMSEKLFKEQQQ